MKLKPSSLTSLLALVLVGVIFLTGCGGTIYDQSFSSCPPYPKAGPAVANELEQLESEKFPALEEWLGRIETLADQLGENYNE